MAQLLPLFRILPAVLVAYGLISTVAGIAELRTTPAIAGMEASYMSEIRIVYLASLVRSFYDMFFMWGLAALVSAANKYLEGKL